MRLIDVDALEKEAAEWFQDIANVEKINGHFNRLERMFLSVECTIMHVIRSLPTIDAVPVVRCGECALRECEGRNGTIVCGKDGNSHKPDWFCADGERRSEDENMLRP